MQHLLLYCRPGFENECAAEIQAQTTALDLPGYVKAKPETGYAVFTPYETDSAAELAQRLSFRRLIFARQLLVSTGLLADLPITDRIGPILATLERLAERISDVWLETADTNDGKTLSTFCRKLTPPLRQALQQSGRLQPQQPELPRLHLFFLSATAVYPALSWPDNSSPWLMGIPRLRLPRSAPSRSALKLEEALHHFLTPAERKRRLAPGMQAVDLGAAPGGWSWLLTRRHMQVTAVDNGPLDRALLDSGLVTHRRADGFRYRPPRPVDWLVCDMVEQPARIARLVAQWLARGDCRASIFNLKLPMKKRYAESERCAAIIADTLKQQPHELMFKQLYHDREEITGYLRVLA